MTAVSSASLLPHSRQTWRVTAATRVFVLAMAAGLAASSSHLPGGALVLAALCVLAVLMSAAGLKPRLSALVPVVEGALASLILVFAAIAPVGPLLAYLAVPPVVAGLRQGSVGPFLAVAAEVSAIAAAQATGRGVELDGTHVDMVLPWLITGFGVGQLAAWMRASERMEQAKAPYQSAHRLLSQLRGLARRLQGGLDTQTIAATLAEEVRQIMGAEHVTLWAFSADGLVATSAGTDPIIPQSPSDPLLRDCIRLESTQHQIFYEQQTPTSRTAVPARVGGRVVGAIVAECASAPTKQRLQALEPALEELTLRLETAMLFDEVRAVATSEERHRLAREIHDGVGQEIASLGYLVDDLAASENGDELARSAAMLRAEISRVVAELRLSIFDLRQGVDPHAGLGPALADYARAVGPRTDMRVHVALQERPGRLRLSTESELLRIAQEAIINARKHSTAQNLWVRLDTESPTPRLSIEDDGVGAAAVTPGHYGLCVMQERAERIGATLHVHERAGGGTVVDVSIPAMSPQPEGADHVDHCAARR
ncbi:MAG TPA: GAF domain-containing sensor histidine kinase [Nocardioidaceae bacterium]|nr:GAF domain-containing sensor histidine kinase [Nocardioidaceae bacterium]